MIQIDIGKRTIFDMGWSPGVHAGFSISLLSWNDYDFAWFEFQFIKFIIILITKRKGYK